MVKLITFVGIVILVIFMFIFFNTMISNFDDNYISSGVINNVKPFNESYLISFENSTAGNLAKNFNDTLTDLFGLGGATEDSGFKVFVLITALPKAVISLPRAMLSMSVMIYEQFNTLALLIGIPKEVITLGVVGIGIVLIFSLVAYLRRTEV